MVLANLDVRDALDERKTMEDHGGGIQELAAADVVYDLDEVFRRVGFICALVGGDLFGDRVIEVRHVLAHPEDVETEV